MIEKAKRAMLCMTRQCWEQGIAAQAMLESGDVDAMVLMARDCVVRQNADGRLCDVENTPASVDPAFCVEAVLTAGRLSGDQGMIDAALRNVRYLLHAAPTTPDGARYHLLGEAEVWVDGLAAGPHTLMLAGHIEEGLAYYEAVKRRLRDPETGLYHHIWHETERRYIRPCYWGVGNGWALVGLMRMARILLDAGDARAEGIIGDFRALADAMLPFQADNGLFHDVLDDAETFYESEVTEMFAYTVYRMVSWKLLEDRYLSGAGRARQAVIRRLGDDGVLHGCSGSPTFDHEGTSVEGQAHFIMMETAARSLGRQAKQRRRA